MGPGTVDGRGDIVSGTSRLVQASNITNFIVYNVTLSQARHPNLYVEGGNGFTAWGVNIRTPADRNQADGIDIDSMTNATVNIRTPADRNQADGIDIDSMTNATVINSSINAGDDGVAVKTNSGDLSNVTISSNKLYGTHGLTVGSIYKNNVSNVLFENNYVYGVDLNGISATTANAVNVKTGNCGLTVSNVYYHNNCVKQGKRLIVMDTNYGSCTGSGTPSITGVVVNGLYSTQSLSGAYTLIDGRSSSYPVISYLANVSLDATTQSSSNQYAKVYLYNSNDVPTGTGVTTSSFSLAGSVPSCSF
jgi:polygalacturonase